MKPHTCTKQTADFRPSRAVVGRFIEPVSASCAEEQNSIVVWVNNQTLKRNELIVAVHLMPVNAPLP